MVSGTWCWYLVLMFGSWYRLLGFGVGVGVGLSIGLGIGIWYLVFGARVWVFGTWCWYVVFVFGVVFGILYSLGVLL